MVACKCDKIVFKRMNSGRMENRLDRVRVYRQEALCNDSGEKLCGVTWGQQEQRERNKCKIISEAEPVGLGK